jgi:hypothetical protein
MQLTPCVHLYIVNEDTFVIGELLMLRSTIFACALLILGACEQRTEVSSPSPNTKVSAPTLPENIASWNKMEICAISNGKRLVIATFVTPNTSIIMRASVDGTLVAHLETHVNDNKLQETAWFGGQGVPGERFENLSPEATDNKIQEYVERTGFIFKTAVTCARVQ